MTLEMQRLEEENNRIFIDAYGLQDELTPEVPLNEITLTCNPHYRYGGDKSEEELEALLLADTMRELVSYAVGCMFGRYSAGQAGADPGQPGRDALQTIWQQLPQPSFPADDDNVIPMLDGDWFADDITLRFRKFLRVAFGEEHYEENLAFHRAGAEHQGQAQLQPSRLLPRRVLHRPCEALQEAPHLLAVLQPQGQLQRADLHAPLPPGYGQRGAQRLPARVPHQAHLAQEPSGSGQHQRRPAARAKRPRR
jgi:hypothetical protein